VSAAGGAITADVVTAVATAYFGQFTGGSDARVRLREPHRERRDITTESPPTPRSICGVGYAFSTSSCRPATA